MGQPNIVPLDTATSFDQTCHV